MIPLSYHSDTIAVIMIAVIGKFQKVIEKMNI